MRAGRSRVALIAGSDPKRFAGPRKPKTDSGQDEQDFPVSTK
jgi:hypothetical protein